MTGKLVNSIEDAIRSCGLKDGMTVSFHHHLRAGDQVLPAVMRVIERMGFHDIKLSASSIHNSHVCLVPLIESKVVTGIDTNFIHKCVGEPIARGIMDEPVVLRTHGNRPAALESGEIGIDIAFIAASAADCCGNMNGKDGPSAFGSMGHAFADAKAAKKVVCITDNLVDYPLTDVSIDESYVDYVVKVDSIGERELIVAGNTKFSTDPLGLSIAKNATAAIEASGLLKDGFAFQTGGGGTSLSAAKFIKEVMVKNQVTGSFILGGINAPYVEMLEMGLFRTIFDCQCFDLEAVRSIKVNKNHQEISASWYANMLGKSCAASKLSAVVLGATEIDTDFNVNVHTDSNGIILGGSGGHTDIAYGAQMTVIVAPLMRARSAIIVDKVANLSTEGKNVDVLVTNEGIAVNPLRKDLWNNLEAAGCNLVDIHDLCERIQKITGIPKKLELKDKVVAKIVNHKGKVIDEIRQIPD